MTERQRDRLAVVALIGSIVLFFGCGFASVALLTAVQDGPEWRTYTVFWVTVVVGIFVWGSPMVWGIRQLLEGGGRDV